MTHLLEGYRVPVKQPFGLGTVADFSSVPTQSKHFFRGIEWEEVCGGARAGAVPCNESPFTGLDVEELMDTGANAGLRTATSFFAYSMIECSMIGGQTDLEEAKAAFGLDEESIVLGGLLRTVRQFIADSDGDVGTVAYEDVTPLDIVTTSARRALGIALSGWDHESRATVILTPNIAAGLGSTIIRVGDHLELRTGELVLVRNLDLALGDDNAPGHIIVLGSIFGFYGQEPEAYATPVTSDTPGFNNDQLSVALRPWVVGFECDAQWYRVQGYDDLT